MIIDKIDKQFWDERLKDYPKTVAKFREWFKRYVDEHCRVEEGFKFSEVPFAFQIGLWWQFCLEQSSGDIRNVTIGAIIVEMQDLEKIL